MSDISSEHDPLFPPATGDTSQSSDWIVGVIDDLGPAAQAEQALLDAGFAHDDLLLLSGPEALRRLEKKDEQAGPLGRMRKAIASVVTDAHSFERAYATDASAGHAILSVHSDADDWVDRARDILARYGAHSIKRYGRWAITDLT